MTVLVNNHQQFPFVCSAAQMTSPWFNAIVILNQIENGVSMLSTKIMHYWGLKKLLNARENLENMEHHLLFGKYCKKYAVYDCSDECSPQWTGAVDVGSNLCESHLTCMLTSSQVCGNFWHCHQQSFSGLHSPDENAQPSYDISSGFKTFTIIDNYSPKWR